MGNLLPRRSPATAQQANAETVTIPLVPGSLDGANGVGGPGANGGPPKVNRNALRHGLYTAEAIKTRRIVRELTTQRTCRYSLD